MACAVPRQHDHDDARIPPTGGALARFLFGFVLAGACPVVALMLAMGGW